MCFFGKRVVKMEYSLKQTVFDDPTPYYSKPKNTIPVFVEYDKSDLKENNGLFIYRIPKNNKLRGFYD